MCMSGDGDVSFGGEGTSRDLLDGLPAVPQHGTLRQVFSQAQRPRSHYSKSNVRGEIPHCPAWGRTRSLLIQSQTCCQLHHGAALRDGKPMSARHLAQFRPLILPYRGQFLPFRFQDRGPQAARRHHPPDRGVLCDRRRAFPARASADPYHRRQSPHRRTGTGGVGIITAPINRFQFVVEYRVSCLSQAIVTGPKATQNDVPPTESVRKGFQSVLFGFELALANEHGKRHEPERLS